MVALFRIFRRVSWDLVGISTSTLCAIHCLVLPFLVMMGSMSGYGIVHNHRLENVIIAVSAVIGLSSLIPSYLNHHRKLSPLYVLLAGFVLILFSRFNVNSPAETILTTFGASTIAIAHLINWKLCRAECTEQE
jgi:hypothetical protein